MADNAATAERFYSAFAALDAATMAACYSNDAHFCDEVFTLNGRDEIAAMWAMLCAAVAQKGRDDWSLTYGTSALRGDVVLVHWDAHYRFSATGRLVQNSIDATLRFDANGLIVDHVDRFDFWRWSRQALGLPGVLLGWSSFLRQKVRTQAMANLCRYMNRG